MPQELSPKNRPVETLLMLLAAPEKARSLGLADWDAIVRVARTARLLAPLQVRLDAEGVLATVPEQVRLHLDSALTVARYRRQMVQWELECIARALANFPGPIVLLKGAAYVAQGLAFAAGRLPSDVDIMVPRAQLDAAERALVDAGWHMEELDPYDEHYYRAWSHELPPMRYPEHPLELDLHHTILPLTGRAKPNAAALFEASTPVAGTRFHVLCPADQVLHACAQLFQDSDCGGRLRDLVDIDSLLRAFGATAGFWKELAARARLHGLARPLSYALRYSARFLGTSVPRDLLAEFSISPGPARMFMDFLVPPALLPGHPDRAVPLSKRAARWLLFLRSHWLRMSPLLLARHALTKALRRLRSADKAGEQ
jgi:hypothetical protein